MLLVAIGGLTFFSFLAAFGKDEGTLGNNTLLNFIADTFYMFRFPTHILFWKYMDGGLFFLGLLANILFYAALIEVIITISKRRRKIEKPVH